MKRLSVLVFSLLAFGMSATLEAGGNAAKGKARAVTKAGNQETCASCHGPDGAKPVAPENPILAGQYSDYIVKALLDYKSGKRKNAVMNGVAAELSRQDIEDLAAWFSSQKSSLHFQR
jgi:cytochrome c553